jgi:hypothetical protein
MDDAPLRKPDHLRPQVSRRAWLGQRPAGAVAAALGLVTFIVVAAAQPTLWSTPDWRLSAPGAAATGIAALASIARREHASALWLAGVGLAGAALVLGWFLMFSIVIAVTAGLILVLHAVM